MWNRPLYTDLSAIYAYICAPIILTLIYILPPFQSPDEAAHFYRAVQLSQANIYPFPVYNTYRRSPGAGGLIDSSAVQVVESYCRTPDWVCSQRERPSMDRLFRLSERAGKKVELVPTQFSNTVVYVPIAHIIPAVSIFVSRKLGLSALTELYCGRLANALFAVSIIFIALKILKGRQSAVLVFVIANLPMTVSLLPTLSADSSVISCSLLLFAITTRILDQSVFTWQLWLVLLISVLFAATAKVAYLPLSVIPLSCAIIACRSVRYKIGIAFVSILALGLTFTWSVEIHSLVFPINLDIRVDPEKQLLFISHNLFSFIVIIVKSAIYQLPQSVSTLLGSRLSDLSVSTPHWLIMLSGLLLIISTVRSGRSGVYGLWRLPIGLILLTCMLLPFVFLYIQNTPVGATSVEGYQGRYMLPILPFLALMIPLYKTNKFKLEIYISQGSAFGSVASMAILAIFLLFRTWI